VASVTSYTKDAIDTLLSSLVSGAHVDGSSHLILELQGSGTIDVGAVTSLGTDLSDIASLSSSNDDIIQRKAGHWTNRTLAQYAADLSSSLLQPKNSDLTHIASLSPSNGDVLIRESGAWANKTQAALISYLLSAGLLDYTSTDVSPIATAASSGVSLQAAPMDHAHTIEGSQIPENIGLLAWNYPPVDAQGSFQLPGSSLTLLRVDIKKAFTWNNVVVYCIGAGGGTAFYAGLFNSSGTRIQVSTDQSTLLHSTGLIEIPLGGGAAMTPGTFVWVALLSTMASVQPTLVKSNAYGGHQNGKLTAANYYVATNGGTQTTIPSSITPSSNAITAGAGVWVGAT
jgi:hypothetical protein